MSDVLQETFTVNIRDKNYVFRIPSIRFDIEVGYESRRIRQDADPLGRGDLNNIDAATIQFALYCAIIKLYLVSADVQWIYSAGPDGKPVIDPLKFPRNKNTTVYLIGEAFIKEYERFRDDGDTTESTST